MLCRLYRINTIGYAFLLFYYVDMRINDTITTNVGHDKPSLGTLEIYLQICVA